MSTRETHRRSNYPPIRQIANLCLFDVGDLVRYSEGPTALFEITSVYPNYGGPGAHRYYGKHCMGGLEGRYEYQVELAKPADHETWKANAKWRKP